MPIAYGSTSSSKSISFTPTVTISADGTFALGGAYFRKGDGDSEASNGWYSTTASKGKSYSTGLKATASSGTAYLPTASVDLSSATTLYLYIKHD